MAKIELTNEQLRLVQRALDLYSRIGILQLDMILDHPSIDKLLYKNCTTEKKLEVGDDTLRGEIVEIGEGYIKTKGRWGNGEEIKTWTDIDKIKLSPNWGKFHYTKDVIEQELCKIKNLLSGMEFGPRGNLGIHHQDSDESCREAFDIVQVIRHEFWKTDPKRSNATVDSHISLTSDAPATKVELDTLIEIRKRKLKKIKNASK